MNPEVLEDLYKRATSKGYSKSIEEFTKLISSNQEVLDDNFDYVKTKGYSKDISQFSKLVGFGEKKNQVVTPSNGEEGLTESITETETTPISSDSLEVTEENKEGVINESELNFEQETDVNLPNELTIEERKNLPYNIRQQLSRENNFTRERLSELNSEKETDKESGFGEYIGTALDVGVSTVSKSIYDTPALIYDGFATITNPIARALGIEEASSEKFAEVFDLKNIPSEIVQKRISEKQKQIQDYNNENGGDALTALENGNILGAAKMIAGTTAQSIPLMIPAFFSGGTSLGIGIVGASTASTKASQIKEENPEIGVGSRTMNAVTTGILESVLGKLLTGASGAVTKKILANEGSKKGAKIISNSFKELLETSIEKSPVLPLFGEILEESLVSVGEQLTDISTGIKTEFSMREVINSGISAVGMGGTNTVSIYAAKGYVSSKKYKQLKKVNKNLSKLSNQLLSSDLSVDEKTLLEESIQRLKSKANGIVDEANDNVSLLSDNDRKELDDTLLKLDEISVTAFSINSNPKTPIEVKQVLLNELKNQASDLTIKKDKILLKENKDGISKQSTETEVPGDAKVSTEQGTDTEMELQQDGEIDGESKPTTENNQEGVTETTDPADTIEKSDSEQVVIEPTDSNNTSFEKGSMKTVTTDGGFLEIGKAKGGSNFQILGLNVDENVRRQGKAERLLIKALEYTKGKLSGMASTEAAVALNYKVGMRSKDGENLSLKETLNLFKEKGEDGYLLMIATTKSELSSEEQVIVNNDNKVESFVNRLLDGESTQEFGDEAQQFYAENQEEIDSLVEIKRKDVPKDESKTRRLATKIANGDTNFSNEQIDLYASNEVDVKAEVEAITKTSNQTITEDTYKGILKSIKSTTRTDKAKQEGENAQRKRFWKSWNKSSRETKKDLKTKRKELNQQILDYAKGKKGKISAAQTRAVINKVNSINLENSLQVDKLIKYTNNVFNNAEFAVKVGIAKKLNESTRKRLNKGKLGSNSDFNNIVSQVLNIPISDISIENIDAYNNFLGKIGKKETVTKLENKLITEAESLYNEIFNPEQEVNEEVEADKKESTDKIVDRINDENVSGEQLVETNAEFIESDLDKIDSITLENLIDKLNKVDTSVPDVAKLIDQANSYAENRQTLLNEVKSKSKKVNIKAVNKLSQNDASAFKSLTEEVTATFTGTELMQTEIHIDNINEGFYTHPANKISQKINAIKRSNPMKSVVVKIASAKTKVFNSRTRLAAKIKANTFGKSKGLSMAGQMMRSNPLSVIDNVFGNYKNSTIRDNTFEPLAEKYQQYKAWINKNTDKIDAAEKLIAPSLKESINKSVKRRFQITSFLLAKEYESNDNKKGTSPANEWIDKTITQYLDNPLKSRYSEQDINILKEIASESSVDGIMSSEKILKQMSPKTKQAVSLLQEVYSGLGDIQAYATTIVRGNELDLVNNYVHHKADVVKDKVDIQLQSQFELFQAGTKSKTSITRTKGAKSIDFDPISTILRGVRATGLDYFLTNEIQTGRQTLKKLQLDVKKDSEKKLVVQSVIDLEAVYNEALENVVQANFSTDVVGGKYLDAARRIGYYATLASVPRAASEFASNLTYSIISDPVSTVLGMTKYSNLGLGQRGLSFAENVKSTTVSKMWNDEILGGSKASQQGVVRGKKVSKSAKSGLGQGLEYAGRFPKVWGKGTEVLANTLLSTPDKMISRPLFFGSFAKTFKDITGVEMDVDKISENDLEYMAKYEDAIKQSKIQADKSVTRAATSNDPFSGILKNQMKDGETRGNTWRTINAYMSRFSINEYATSRQAIASMVGQGEMTVLQGAATMTAVLARMSMYVVLYKFMQNFAYGLMGAGNDDDDTDYESLGIRQTVGAATSLITRGTTGNIGMMPVNLGIEMLNKEYGYEFGLREDKVYDPFKHSLVYSQISQDQIDRNPYKQIVLTGLGPLAPQFKSLSYLTDKSYKGLFSKTKEGRRKAIDELLSARAAVELFNIPGAMPFYKDIRGALVKEQYKDYGKETGTPSMSTLKKYDIDTYNLIKKQEAEFKNSSEYKAMERERKKFKQSLKN